MFGSNNTVRPNFVKLTVSDCIVCLFRPVINYSSLVGLTPITINCEHSKHPAKNAFCKWSFFHTIITTILLLFLMFAIFMYVYLVINCKEKLECMEIIAETIFIINSAIVVAFSLFRNKMRILYLTSWIDVFNKKSMFGFKTIIDEKKMKIIWNNCKIYKIFLVVFMIFCSVMYFFLILYKASGWLHFIRTTSLVGLLIQLLIILEYSTYNIFTNIIMDICYVSLVESMIKRVPSITKPEIYKKIEMLNSIRGLLTLEERIRQTRRFHTVIIQNFEFIVKLLNPIAVLWLGSNLAVLIINTYVLCLMFFNNPTNYVIVLQFKTYLLIICIIYLLNLIQETGQKVIFRNIFFIIYLIKTIFFYIYLRSA